MSPYLVCVCLCVCGLVCNRPTPANMYFKQRLTRLSARRASGQRRKAATLLVSFRHDIIARSRSVTHSASLTCTQAHIQTSREYACAHKCRCRRPHSTSLSLSLALARALSLSRPSTHTLSLSLSCPPTPPKMAWSRQTAQASRQSTTPSKTSRLSAQNPKP